MKKLLILLGLILAFFLGKGILNSLKEPAEGTVEVEVVDETINEEGGVDGTTVPEEPVEEEVEEEVVEEEPAKPAFVPVKVTLKDFKNNSRIKKFAKANGGTVVVVGGGITAVKIGDAYYFKKDGKLFVNVDGQTIKL